MKNVRRWYINYDSIFEVKKNIANKLKKKCIYYKFVVLVFILQFNIEIKKTLEILLKKVYIYVHTSKYENWIHLFFFFNKNIIILVKVFEKCLNINRYSNRYLREYVIYIKFLKSCNIIYKICFNINENLMIKKLLNIFYK